MRFRTRALATLIVLLAGCGSSGRPAPPVTRVIAAPPSRILATARVGVGPVAVSVGAGAVWVADGAAGTVTRVDRTTHSAGPPIAVGAGPVAITAGAYGVWVADASGAVVHVDPVTRRVIGPPIPVVDPAGIATGDGAVWVTSRRSDSVIRVDPTGARPVTTSIHVGSQPTAVAVEPGGVWIANSADGTVTRVDPRTQRADAPVRVATGRTPRQGVGQRSHEQPGAQVLDLAIGDGAVWVAKTDRAQTDRIDVVRIDPRSHETAGRPIAVTGGVPMRLAVTRGIVWVTDVGSVLPGPSARPPALLRIDTRAGARSGPPLRIASEPTGLAAAPGAVWLTTAGNNAVSEVVAPR